MVHVYAVSHEPALLIYAITNRLSGTGSKQSIQICLPLQGTQNAGQGELSS